MTKVLTVSVLVILSALEASASGNNRPDLSVSLTPPSVITVYQSAGYNIRVRNVGNKPAAGVVLRVDLPQTATSPQVRVMGTVGAFSSACSLANTRLTCQLGSIARNGSASIFFDLALPYSTNALVISASATTTSNPGDGNPANNGVTYTAVPRTVPVTVNTSVTANNDHCTGQPTLSSFFECTLFPSSISSHQTIFNAGGTITFVGAPATFTGTWTYSAATHRLRFSYFDSGNLVASFDGRGVSATCAEGVTTFTPDNGYISLYRVCFP